MVGMNKLIALLTALFFFVAPVTAHASPYALQDPGAAIAPMQKGDVAPFAGTLFSVEAASKVLVDMENAEQQCKIETDQEVEKVKADAELTLANERAAKEAAQTKYTDIVQIKNDQITFLETHVEREVKKNKRNWGPVWFSGGVLGGILITIAAGYALGQVGTN